MLVPFLYSFRKIHNVEKLTSDCTTEAARELQSLVDADDRVGYRKREAEFKHEGLTFRLTKGIVYQTFYKDERIDVRVKVQVKGFSLTWYFWVPDGMDQYPQSFRDKLYNAAAIAHKKVAAGCDLYYRGSNAIHIKRMHHDESESNHNHNHYRLVGDKPYTPEDFQQHMDALATSEICDEFFEKGELTHVCEAFARFYRDWIAKEPGKLSKEEEYLSYRSQLLVVEDVIELNLFGRLQEPCRIVPSELKVDYESARQRIQKMVEGGTSTEEVVALLHEVDKQYEELLGYRLVGGSRGLNSAIASSRQIEGSKNPVVTANMGMDDALGKEVPDIPSWAESVVKAVELAHQKLLADAKLRVLREAAEVEYLPPVPAEIPPPQMLQPMDGLVNETLSALPTLSTARAAPLLEEVAVMRAAPSGMRASNVNGTFLSSIGSLPPIPSTLPPLTSIADAVGRSTLPPLAQTTVRASSVRAAFLSGDSGAMPLDKALDSMDMDEDVADKPSSQMKS